MPKPTKPAEPELLFITTKKQLHALVEDHGFAVVKFTADWCPPCATYAPVFKKVADGRPNFVQVDIDEPKAKKLVEAFDVSSIPSTLFLNRTMAQKKSSAMVVGVLTKKNLTAAVKELSDQDTSTFEVLEATK